MWKSTKIVRSIVGLKVLTAVTMKSMIFWIITPCSLVEVYVSENYITSISKVKK
jgi:hypothetical protein